MSDKPSFQITPTPSGTELRLGAGHETIPFRARALCGNAGADLCQRLLLDGTALDDEDMLLVDDLAIARLTAAEAARLDLPPVTALRAVVRGDLLRQEFAELANLHERGDRLVREVALH